MEIAESPKVSRSRKKREIPGITHPMTYEEYLASPEEMRRYDIIGGWKVSRTWGEKKVPNPTRLHQRIQRNIARGFEGFETTHKTG